MPIQYVGGTSWRRPNCAESGKLTTRVERLAAAKLSTPASAYPAMKSSRRTRRSVPFRWPFPVALSSPPNLRRHVSIHLEKRLRHDREREAALGPFSGGGSKGCSILRVPQEGGYHAP